MEIEPNTGYNELSNDDSKNRSKPKWRFGRQGGRKQSESSLHQNDEYNRFDDDEEGRFQEEEEVYIVKQRWGYCSIVFSIVQVRLVRTHHTTNC